MTVRELFGVISFSNRDITINRDGNMVYYHKADETISGIGKCMYLDCKVVWIWEIGQTDIRIDIE